jgi:hypothetical protein
MYAAYYDGSRTHSCGGAEWPGNAVALYLKGTPPDAPPCNNNRFARSITSPGYLEFAMLHEIFHALGAAPTCAPHHTMEGHVSDDPTDLMYAGPLEWAPSRLDTGRDDYFGHNRPGRLDVARSAFLRN